VKTSLYLHIPFCRCKCDYCDFNSFDSSGMSPEEYVPLLLDEMTARARRFSVSNVPTVYFGGGTPSLLQPRLVARLLQAASELFPMDVAAEITLEINPGTVTPESLHGYRSAGVNRLSVGVQSLDERELALLGRIHTAGQAVETVSAARRAGFDNIGLDLMHTLPGQSLGRWEKTLRQAVALGVEHISAYGLSIEEGTPFGARFARGELIPVDPELGADMFELTRDFLQTSGYEHYEISNFALPGYRSRHNQVYWRRGSYLGFGAGAHSFARQAAAGLRWNNPSGLDEYATFVAAGAVGDVEHVSRHDAMAEFFFLGLRMLEGVDLAAFAAEFGILAEKAFPTVLERFTDAGMLNREGDLLRLTRRGLMLANRVLAEFV